MSSNKEGGTSWNLYFNVIHYKERFFYPLALADTMHAFLPITHNISISLFLLTVLCSHYYTIIMKIQILRYLFSKAVFVWWNNLFLIREDFKVDSLSKQYLLLKAVSSLVLAPVTWAFLRLQLGIWPCFIPYHSKPAENFLTAEYLS